MLPLSQVVWWTKYLHHLEFCKGRAIFSFWLPSNCQCPVKVKILLDRSCVPCMQVYAMYLEKWFPYLLKQLATSTAVRIEQVRRLKCAFGWKAASGLNGSLGRHSPGSTACIYSLERAQRLWNCCSWIATFLAPCSEQSFPGTWLGKHCRGFTGTGAGVRRKH